MDHLKKGIKVFSALCFENNVQHTPERALREGSWLY
jgi:hypothetical protein